MAKSNLKGINNNGVTQTTSSSLYSKHSYIYYTYIYLNFLFFFYFFFTNNIYYNLIDNYILKFSNKKQIMNNNYKSFFLKNYSIEKFNKLYYNILVKIFFFNGCITHLYDFYLLRTYTLFFKQKVFLKKLNIIRVTNKINSLYNLLQK